MVLFPLQCGLSVTVKKNKKNIGTESSIKTHSGFLLIPANQYITTPGSQSGQLQSGAWARVCVCVCLHMNVH